MLFACSILGLLGLPSPETMPGFSRPSFLKLDASSVIVSWENAGEGGAAGMKGFFE
jgi:hypothetical protein